MIIGISGGQRDAVAALGVNGQISAVCAQERVTRQWGAGVTTSGLPDQAVDLLLERAGRARADITRYVCANADAQALTACDHIDHHFAHACTAYLTSPFPFASGAAVAVLDDHAPYVTVWAGERSSLTQIPFPWEGPGFVAAYLRIVQALGFSSSAGPDPRAEALARLDPDGREPRIEQAIRLTGQGLHVDPDLEARVAELSGGPAHGATPDRARMAAALHARLCDALIEFLTRVRGAGPATRLCLGGSLFRHSWINTRVRQSGVFDEVFVPVDPGNGGLAVGAALHALGSGPANVSPFLGPSYSAEEIKEVLDNCKLNYRWESEEGAASAAVRALRDGRLVGWFDAAMEWGPRALGARCILANPSAPYVLENLNRFLKRREPWRGYAVSGLQEHVADHFDGPARAPFMECDYRPKDPTRLSHALPLPGAAIRVQTVDAHSGPPRFRRLLEAFGEASGLPFLINTSFNGFHEPIVCSPRDAVRVFYGSGLDVLVIGQFVVSK
jgi:carbamoyltransferase